jgi:hypothetical protein
MSAIVKNIKIPCRRPGAAAYKQIPGAKNVLPWEAPLATVEAVRAFCGF